MSYELQVYSLSPLRPSPKELVAKAGESGLAIEWAKAPGAASVPEDTRWTKVLMRNGEAAKGGFLVEASTELDRMTAQFRQDAEAGDEIPEQVLEARQLYVLELDDEAPEAEEHQAAFVVAAWALASLTDGIVFDPQEEFFADADSFWAILTDESLGDELEEGEGEEEDGDDEGAEHGHSHAGGCCSTGPRPIDIGLPAQAKGAGADAPASGNEDKQWRNRE